MPDAPRSTVRRLMWFFAIVYAVEGAGQAKGGIIWQPLLHFLKEIRGWSPVEASASLAVLDLPWVIKPLYGLVSDFIPLFGYRRRSYLLAGGLALVLAFSWVARIDMPEAIIPGLLVTSVALAVTSTICGALLVEAGQRHNASARFVNQQWLWFNAAAMASAVIGGMLVEILSPIGALHAAAWIAAAFSVLVVGSAILIDDQRAPIDTAAMRYRLNGFVSVFRSRTLWLIAGFLFCYYFSPGFGTPLYYHLTDKLGFSQGFIGVLSSASAGGWIAGGLIYHFWLIRLDEHTLLRVSIIGGVISSLLYLGLSGPVTALAVYFLSGIAAMVANIATLTLASNHCPAGAEGFTFAALMSVINLAAPLSDTVGSLLYERVFGSHLPPLILVSAGFTAAVLLFLRFVPISYPARHS